MLSNPHDGSRFAISVRMAHYDPTTDRCGADTEQGRPPLSHCPHCPPPQCLSALCNFLRHTVT